MFKVNTLRILGHETQHFKVQICQIYMKTYTFHVYLNIFISDA